MNRPWLPFHTRDWLDNKELRRCSPTARAVLADLMCLAHEGAPYGYLADKVGPLTVKYMASRCVVTTGQFLKAVAELTEHGRVQSSEEGLLFIERMVIDEDIRLRRAAGGNKSVGHPHTHPRKSKEGYPSMDPSGDPLLEIDSRGRAGADSDSDSSSSQKQKVSLVRRAADALSWESVNEAWKWYRNEFPGEINEFIEAQLFISVMETPQDLLDLRQNLPLWKQSKQWIEGYFPSSENFISKRIFKVTPKGRDSPSPTAAQARQQQTLASMELMEQIRSRDGVRKV